MATKTRPTINATDRRTAATKAWLAAKHAADVANAALKEARDTLLRVLPEGEGVIAFDDKKVALDIRLDPSYDVEKLQELVSADVFNSVTESRVVTNAWKAALQFGDIDESVVDAVVSFNEVVVLKEVK